MFRSRATRLATKCFQQKRNAGGKREPRDPKKPGINVRYITNFIQEINQLNKSLLTQHSPRSLQLYPIPGCSKQNFQRRHPCKSSEVTMKEYLNNISSQISFPSLNLLPTYHLISSSPSQSSACGSSSRNWSSSTIPIPSTYQLLCLCPEKCHTFVRRDYGIGSSSTMITLRSGWITTSRFI